ncbi:MAG: bifunctional pyr operon transcriptional regulator/uracil phosphoribosyltransferase PyrR [Phycisphaerae bacterium]|nr:bifunctional pyr operon transcriptional regulator/uracil phosphoribosyltransferase PyrR [Phycisphaerae bacterium]
MEQTLTANQVREAIDRLYEQVLAHVPDDVPVAVIGVRTRGETLAGRIVERLEADRADLPVRYGVLDITFYRDDLSRRRGVPLVRATEIDFDLDDTWVLLVDDVLQTGRSVRAALDALADFGRPRVVRLAALIDRGGRELPIAADFVGRRVDAPDGARVQVRFQETDGTEGVFILTQD